MKTWRDRWLPLIAEEAWRCVLGACLGALGAFGQLYLRNRGVMMSLMILPYPAILLAVSLFGLAAGIAAVVTATLALAYVVEPGGSLVIAAQRDALDLLLFCGVALVLVVLADRRKKALDLARAAHARASDAAAAKEAMMEVLAHDLRNPLQTVALTSELLIARLAADDRAVGMLERMQRSVQRAVLLIDAVVERAQAGEGTLRVRKARFPVVDLVGELAAQYEPLATARGIALRLPATDALGGDVWCDKERMLQVLGNLLGNALKFTPPGGDIDVDVHCDDDGAHFAIRDSGRGMTEDELAHCFERLWRGSGAGYGSGLGLWIARTLVEAHRGKLSVTSALGQGTTMRIDLPPEPVALATEGEGHPQLVSQPAT